MNVFELFATLSLDKSQYEDGLSSASDSASSFGSALTQKLGTAAKVGAASVAALGTAVAAGTTALVGQVSSVAEYGDNIDKMSQKLGMSAQAYQEWDAIMQHSGTSIEAMQSSMKTLATAAETGNEAFEALGFTEEELASLNQEELFAETIRALQEMDDETQRTYVAGQLLGRGATELGALLNTSAEDTEAMRQRVHELGGVMSDEAVSAAAEYQDSIQDMKTALSGLTRTMTVNFLPGFTAVSDGLAEIFSGDSGKGLAKISEGVNKIITSITKELPKFLKVGTSIVKSLASAILTNLPSILSAGADIVLELAEGAIDALPDIVDVGVEIIETLVQGLTKALPKLIPAAADAILEIADSLTDPTTLDTIVDSAIDIVMALIDGLTEALPKIAEKAPEIIENLVTGITNNLGKLVEGAVQIITKLASSLTETSTIQKLIEKAPEIIASLVKGLVESAADIADAVPDLLIELGKGMIDMLSQGFINYGKIVANLASGISSNAEGIDSAGKALAQEFVRSFTEALSLFFPGLGTMWDMSDLVLGQLGIDTSGGSQAQETSMSTATTRSASAAKQDRIMEQILTDLDTYLPAATEQKSVFLDSGALVGAMFPSIDLELGNSARSSARGGVT